MGDRSGAFGSPIIPAPPGRWPPDPHDGPAYVPTSPFTPTWRPYETYPYYGSGQYQPPVTMNYGPAFQFPEEFWRLMAQNAQGGGGGGGGGQGKGKKGGGEDNGGGEGQDGNAKKGGGGGGGDGNASGSGGGGGGDTKKRPPELALINCLCGISSQRIHYDIRQGPETALLSDSGGSQSSLREQRNMPITAPLHVAFVRLISFTFPWSIEVKNDSGVTLKDLLGTLHTSFMHVVTEGEYWSITDEQRSRIGHAYNQNHQATVPPSGPNAVIGYGGAIAPLLKPRDPKLGVLRVDWLLDQTIFVGLQKNDEFAATRFPNMNPKERSNVWVVNLVSNGTK